MNSNFDRTGFILVSIDISDREYQPLTCLAFSLNKEELEASLNVLEQEYTDQLNEYESQSTNCDEYIEAFEKAWKKYEQKNVIPFYTQGIPQSILKPQTREEHAQYKFVKDFNIENGRKNRNLNFAEKCKFISSYMIQNPPDESFKKFIDTGEGTTILKSTPNKYISYFISKVGELIR